MKRNCNYILLILFMLSIISPIGIEVSYATPNPSSDGEKLGIRFVTKTEAEKDKLKPASERYRIEEGDLIFITINRKATTNIKYQTAGWIVRKTGVAGVGNKATICTDNGVVTESSKLNGECTPLQGTNHFEIPKSQFSQRYENDVPGTSPVQLKTVFVLTKDKFKAELKKHEEFIGIEDETTLYFNTTFNVTIQGNIVGPVYKTLSSIREAQPWADKTGFRQYYDLPVTFRGGADKLVVETRLESNQATKLKEDWNDPKEYNVSDPITPVVLEKTIVKDSKTYTLACSYIMPDSVDTRGNCSSPSTAPYYQFDSNTTTRQPTMSYGGTRVIALYEEMTSVKCKCNQEIFIPGLAEIGGKIENPKIGKKIPVQVKMHESAASIKNWETFLSTRKDIKINIRLWRSDVAQANSGNTGAAPIWEKVGSSPQWDTEVPVNADQVIQYLKGNNVPSYNDNLMNYPIEPGKKVSFRYNVSVSIVSTDKVTGVRESVSCYGIDSPRIDFYRPPAPEPGFGYYTSTPQYWSEIKEGSPSLSGTGSNETFEAMAGTPTTRNLYFASGGSEYIVDIVTKYEPSATATRTYTSIFTSVPSGWNMAPIPGPVGHDSDPGQPAARTKCDVSGACYTEQVTQASWKHVTKEAVPCSGDPCTGGSPEESETDYQWTQQGYNKTVGGYTDTWTQTSTFDYMKIVKAQVWKLNRSKVNEMIELLETDEVTASITQGSPTVFSNIAGANTSAAGRLRYSNETNQHDHVVWNEGPSDNRDANSDSDSYVNEKKKFEERRKETTDVTSISDFLILQTSTGDQSVMYFEKTSPSAKLTDPLTVPTSSFEAMWTNNPNSAAKWGEYDIHIGSYNGKYSTPSSKYSGSGGATVSSILDTLPAGLVRPTRPSSPMRLMQTGLDISDTKPNGLYVTGQSTVFYQNVLDYNPTNLPEVYSTEVDPDYGFKGQSYVSSYSAMDSKVNDIIIHNPVSTQFAMIDALPSKLDQRTNASVSLGGNLMTPVIEYERVLKPGYVFVPTPPTYEEIEVPNPDYVPPLPDGGLKSFIYTGAVQTLPITVTGNYSFEVWGAQGGSTGYESDKGGLGGYSKGNITLTKGDTLYIYAGESPYSSTFIVNGGGSSIHAGGWNGGGKGTGAFGGGGGASDIRLNGQALTDRIIVAGGGGGGGETVHVGASGGGASGETASNFVGTPGGGGTQASGGVSTGGSANGSFGIGGDGPGASSADEGGGGGGWYGGGAGSGEAVAGGGGSGYIGGVSSGSMAAGMNNGHGRVKITTPTAAVGSPTIISTVMTDPGISVPPDSAYDLIPITTDPNATVVVGSKSHIPAKFILLDYGFTLFFPNIGDFYGDGASGLLNVTSNRGKGFIDKMSTTEWTKEKSVKFAYNVILNGVLYPENEWIDLPVARESFDFYVPLGNKEKVSALVEFKSIAINGEEDNNATTNKVRYSNYAARHSALKQYNIDLVGRIGNMVIEDTGDFRYSNLFKMPLDPRQWLIKNVVKKVDPTTQNKIVGDIIDIRGETLTSVRGYLDTYGMLPHLRQNPIAFPLSPEKNNIPSLRKQPIRLGYDTLMDIQTIGNYYDKMQIIPYYYYLDLETGTIEEVDIYMNVKGTYKPINKSGAAVPGWDPTTIYQHGVSLDWLSESKRRNVSAEEMEVTNTVAEYKYSLGLDANIGPAGTPDGNNYKYGIAQILNPTGRNRTYIGSTTTNGLGKNPGNTLPQIMYQEQAQRWHYSLGLPSSSVAVEKGKEPTVANINDLRKSTTKVLLLAADIKAVGDTYVLQYETPNNNGTINFPGFPPRSLSAIPFPVINVYSINKSSADDLDIFGTH